MNGQEISDSIDVVTAVRHARPRPVRRPRSGLDVTAHLITAYILGAALFLTIWKS